MFWWDGCSCCVVRRCRVSITSTLPQTFIWDYCVVTVARWSRTAENIQTCQGEMETSAAESHVDALSVAACCERPTSNNVRMETVEMKRFPSWHRSVCSGCSTFPLNCRSGNIIEVQTAFFPSITSYIICYLLIFYARLRLKAQYVFLSCCCCHEFRARSKKATLVDYSDLVNRNITS